MVAEQNTVKTIIQPATEVAKGAVMAVREEENPVNAARSVQAMSRTGGIALNSQQIPRTMKF